jgi:hypothetical protein
MARDSKRPRKAKRPRGQRVAQMRQAYAMTRKVDRRVGLYIGLTFAAVLAAFVLVGFLVDHPIYLTVLGLPAAMLAATIVFGRRAQAAAYSQVEGQPGAAAAVLQTLRRGWFVTPAVAVTRGQDVVHRAVGRPGIVLVSEGPPSRARNLLAQERKKLARILPDVPVHEIQSGDEEGQVPLRKLQRAVVRKPRALRPAQVAEVERRLKAMGGMQVPIPKGPMPRGARMPRGPQPR